MAARCSARTASRSVAITWLFVSLPIERVAPTPFQRDVSDAHVRKLTHAMDKTRRFLDPLIVVQRAEGLRNAERQPSPHGAQGARREKPCVGLLVPEAGVAYQILALNIEKAHNLREKAIEVARMYRDLARFSSESESALRARVRGAEPRQSGLCV